MGFLSAYSGTRRVEIGDGYWVDVKECLSIVEKQRAEKALGSPIIDNAGRRSAVLDTPAFHTEMVVASIVAWNLDEDSGEIWDLASDPVKRRNIARLPGPVFDQILKVVDELNAPKKLADRQRFPAGDLGGDPDGDSGAGLPVDVPAGAGAVEAPGAAPTGPGVPALA